MYLCGMLILSVQNWQAQAKVPTFINCDEQGLAFVAATSNGGGDIWVRVPDFDKPVCQQGMKGQS
jgi:hypothetical protein